MDIDVELLKAAEKGNTETVKFLLEKVANTEVQNDVGETALIYAVQSKDAKIISLVKEAQTSHEAPIKVAGGSFVIHGNQTYTAGHPTNAAKPFGNTITANYIGWNNNNAKQR